MIHKKKQSKNRKKQLVCGSLLSLKGNLQTHGHSKPDAEIQLARTRTQTRTGTHGWPDATWAVSGEL